MKVLIISDTHFCCDDIHSRNSISEKIFSYFVKAGKPSIKSVRGYNEEVYDEFLFFLRHHDCKEFEFIIHLGDLAESSEGKDMSVAADKLTEIRECIKISDAGPTVIIVPGNHDKFDRSFKVAENDAFVSPYSLNERKGYWSGRFGHHTRGGVNFILADFSLEKTTKFNCGDGCADEKILSNLKNINVGAGPSIALSHYDVLNDNYDKFSNFKDSKKFIKYMVDAGIQLLICGHTHKSTVKKHLGVCVVNPGSLSSFFSENNGFAIIEFSENGLRKEVVITMYEHRVGDGFVQAFDSKRVSL